MVESKKLMKKDKYNGIEALILKNDLVKATILPKHQGRIIEYVSNNTGHNHIWHDFSSRYGITNAGIMLIVRTGALNDKWKVLMNDIPMDWNNCEYKLEDEKDLCQAITKAQGNGLELVQKSQIFNNSSALLIDAYLKNKSKGTVKTQLNVRGSWAVGGEANASDTLIISQVDGLLKHRYVGNNYQQSVPAPGNWAAISDFQKKESVLIVGDENLLVYYIYISALCGINS